MPIYGVRRQVAPWVRGTQGATLSSAEHTCALHTTYRENVIAHLTSHPTFSTSRSTCSSFDPNRLQIAHEQITSPDVCLHRWKFGQLSRNFARSLPLLLVNCTDSHSHIMLFSFPSPSLCTAIQILCLFGVTSYCQTTTGVITLM